MDEILAKIQEVYAGVVALQAELSGKLAQVNETANQQRVLSEQLATKETALNEREAALDKIDDLIQYRKDADLKMSQANSAQIATDRRIADFSRYEDEVKKKNQDESDKLAKFNAALTAKEAQLENLILEKVKSVLRK